MRNESQKSHAQLLRLVAHYFLLSTTEPVVEVVKVNSSGKTQNLISTEYTKHCSASLQISQYGLHFI